MQTCCGHLLEHSFRYVGFSCDGCYGSHDSGASFRCTKGCDFDICGSCHASGYPSAAFPSCRRVDIRRCISSPVGLSSAAKCTALHNAARQGDSGGVKALLEDGSDVHSKDPGGYSFAIAFLPNRRFRACDCVG